MKEVVFSDKAYCKIMMHSAKYPHCNINGILLAADGKDNENSKTITYLDAIPLFHLCLYVSPMAEIALTQIELWAESAGLVIAGYYLGNENLYDINHERSSHKIADKIADKFRSACITVVDNKLVTLIHELPAIRSLQSVDNKWKMMDKSKVIVDHTTLQKTSLLLKEKSYYKLIDFDNHLDNISLDWKNLSLNKQIENLLSDKKSKKS